jgi:4-hydroxyacetophenone monooxygenase
MSECQAHYAMSGIVQMIEKELSAIDCKTTVYGDYARRLEDELAGMLWSHPGAPSWYKNAQGKVVTTLPWRFVDYWSWTRFLELADYELDAGDEGSVSAPTFASVG